MGNEAQPREPPVTLAYPLAVRYRTCDLARAEAFLSGVLDIPVRERGKGYLRLDNGSICLWLVEGTAPAPQTPLTLVLAAGDVKAAMLELLTRPFVVLHREPTWTGPDRFEAELRLEDWLHLVVGRTYNEDELDVVPDLETELEWEPPARELLRLLLKRVPVSFRQSARDKSVARSECLAVERGDVIVQKLDAIRAIVEVTPRFQHQLLRDALIDQAEDLGPVASHFAHLNGGAP